MTTTSQQAVPSITVEGSIPDAMNARGRLLTTQRWNKVANSCKSTCDERNFGDWGYEVTTRREGHAKVENEIEKELHVLKQQLKGEKELLRRENELQ